MEIKLKQKHKAKLKKLGAYDQFVKNIEKSFNTVSFEILITNYFTWKDTPEGHDFWNKISKK